MLKPKLFTTLKNYSWPEFRKDFTSGVVVGIVALPLAIAFAIASGVSPERGLFTAIIAGFLISALGGSRVQIGGPTGAFVVIVYSIVQKHGMDGLLIATVMAGVFLMMMGFFRFGSAIKFIPYPVVVGFTSGIALIIFSSQVKDFFGLPMGTVPADFWEKWVVYAHHFGGINYYALAVGAISIVIIIFWKKVSQRIPGPLVALIVSIFLVRIFHLPVETIGSRFGVIPHVLPPPSLPHVDFEMVRNMIPSAITIALLAGIESLLSAVVADGMIGGKHRPNMELVAQGIANAVSPLFGGMPAAGAIARTATNINNGGRTPVAGMVHALVLLMIMLFFGKWAVLIPLATLAAILIIVAYHMSEWHSFLMTLKSPKSDVAVLLTTFSLTVILDLTVAIQVGMLLSVFLFMRRMALVTNVEVITRELVDEEETEDPNAISKREVPPQVEVYEINGPFFFGAVHQFREAMNVTGKTPKVRIIRMRDVPAIDATGIHALKEEYANSKKHGIAFILSDVHTQPLIALERSGLLDAIGEDNVFGNIDDALNRAREILRLPPIERHIPFVPTVKREMNPNPDL
ncbi:MAG: sodium-independent anion transporter [Omnitrophica bacterium RIFCSPHIGHO2_02_FULL_46_11]|nr:MAG: sodium-independent anion transporter [Omnitrophica bacterium RIFCSPHIGHO2_02_FULL_46_11]OGW87390.1 MAG: sodium-independent anion transporter [Omnitrophica bacterium RIFCSPLOWO2_01_FULL_45_10b]